MGGTNMGHGRRSVRLVAGALLTAGLATLGLSSVGGAAVPAAEEGVTSKTCDARARLSGDWCRGLDLADGALGVSTARRPSGRGGRCQRAHDQGDPRVMTPLRDRPGPRLRIWWRIGPHVFAVVEATPFAFLSYRWLLEHHVPMIGGGTDGTYYQDKGNEDILSSSGNSVPFGDLAYDISAHVMKQLGATKVGALAYGAATASVSSAKAFMNYAVPAVGLDPAYTNTSVDFGSSDVGPLVLGIKNSGINAVYLPMAAATNITVTQGLQQSGVNMKATILGNGYGQGLFDSPAGKILPSSVLLTLGNKPVEVKDTATKAFQADLKKYGNFTGVPDFGMYGGYILADYAIKSLAGAGKSLTRQGLIDAGHGMGTYDQAGLACASVDVSLAGRGTTPAKSCGYFVQVKNDKYVLFPKNGKPVTGKLVGTPAALASAARGAVATTTTAATP